MVVSTSEKTYIITQKCDETEHIIQYICYEETQQIPLRMTKQFLDSVNRAEIAFLTAQRTSSHFTDLIDFFTDEEALYILTKFPHRGYTLSQKLDTEFCTLSERLEIFKNILERLILQDVHPFFACACMNPSYIYIEPSGVIWFDYDISDIANGTTYVFAHVQQKISSLISVCFAQELQQKTMKELETFLYQLKQEQFPHTMAVFQQYWSIYQQYIDKKTQDLEPRNFWFLVWVWFKKVMNVLKTLIAPALILCAVAYLVYSIYIFVQEPDKQQNFTHIGTQTYMTTQQEGGAE